VEGKGGEERDRAEAPGQRRVRELHDRHWYD
jgi:hypothetical protein